MKRQGYFAGAMIVLGCVAGAMRGGAQETPPAAAPPVVKKAVTVMQEVTQTVVRVFLRRASVNLPPENVDALAALVQQHRSAYGALRKAEKNVAQAVRANIAPAQLRVLLNEWSALAQDERERRVAALQNFAAAADVPGNPRLESSLRLTGIMGDEEAYMDTPRQAIKRQARTPQDMMAALGFDDQVLQSAVIEHLRREQEALQPLLQRSIALNDTLRMDSTNAQVTEALREWRAAVQQDKERRAAAVQALDARIGFSKNVRLAALLRLIGIVGDEASLLNGDEIGFNTFGITHKYQQQQFANDLTNKASFR